MPSIVQHTYGLNRVAVQELSYVKLPECGYEGKNKCPLSSTAMFVTSQQPSQLSGPVGSSI